MSTFNLTSDFTPRGDQPEAIGALCDALTGGQPHCVLLGVTGSGKTFTIAHVMARLERPALIIAPNKTLAGQLYHEFKGLFPENAVEYFVSYYDYYQPEAYIPASDTYIQKDSAINEMIDKMRHAATMAVLTRRDVIVVASVSCIFGLGAPEDYLAMRLELAVGHELRRDQMLKKLVDMQYARNDVDFHRGVFRVRGDRVEIFPAYEEETAVRVDFFGDEIEGLFEIDPLRGVVRRSLTHTAIFPASHYVTSKSTQDRAVRTIMAELKARVALLREQNKLLEAQRLEERTNYDVEMIMEMGYCNGIENYSRHLTGRDAGTPSPTLLDYFPPDFITFIDESHIAVPQLRGMYNGDRARKQTLVDYGFRLPSALDNRPLQFHETQARLHQVVYVSATPAEYERQLGQDAVVELIVRPTGLVDPLVEVRSARNQVDDLLDQIQACVARNTRVLVTTTTKRMAEDLSEYYVEAGVAARYLHSEVKTLERMAIIQDLRRGEFDVLIGINLLREGLDIPEVGLVAILDADKEGFLRSAVALIQTFGRAARNLQGRVIMYADRITAAMQTALDETDRRRTIQEAFNTEHNIIPAGIEKKIGHLFPQLASAQLATPVVAETPAAYGDVENADKLIRELEKDMRKAAASLEFEKAALLRDQLRALRAAAVFEIPLK